MVSSRRGLKASSWLLQSLGLTASAHLILRTRQAATDRVRQAGCSRQWAASRRQLTAGNGQQTDNQLTTNGQQTGSSQQVAFSKTRSADNRQPFIAKRPSSAVHHQQEITRRQSPEGHRQQDIASSNETPQRGKEPRVSCTIGRKHAWRQESGKGFIRHDVQPASTSSAQDITKQRTHQK